MTAWSVAAIVLVIAAGASTRVSAQTQMPTYSGETDYQEYCSSCHGDGAKGDGAFATSLLRRPSDLTTLARRNRGRFPKEKVFKAVDGRRRFVHPDSDMPAWAGMFAADVESSGAEKAAARINALVKYLQTLQVK